MPITPRYPGVYIEEIPSSVRTIAGVSTSVAMFIGRTKDGPMDEPTLCLNRSEFERKFTSDCSFSDLPRQVELFFANGGTQCYVMRIANGAGAASVTLKSELKDPVLQLEAKNKGKAGDDIRIAISYSGPRPEATFNMEIFRWAKSPSGNRVREKLEVFRNLSMDPNSPRFAPDILEQSSSLVNGEASIKDEPTDEGLSISGRLFATDNVDDLKQAWQDVFDTGNSFQVSVADGPYLDITVIEPDISSATDHNGVGSLVVSAFEDALSAAGITTCTVAFVQNANNDAGYLKFSETDGDILIRRSPNNDLAAALMLGTDQGGIEISRYAGRRPAPTGTVFKLDEGNWTTFATMLQNSINAISISGSDDITFSLETTLAADPLYKSDGSGGGYYGVPEKLGIIANSINDYASDRPDFKFKAETWGYRLAIIPTTGGDNNTVALETKATDVNSLFSSNVRHYSLGIAGGGEYQDKGPAGTDGVRPKSGDYIKAYEKIDEKVDLFNLMVLPRDHASDATKRKDLWPRASSFCEKRRAFLLIDPRDIWTDVSKATDPVDGVNSLRQGLAKNNAAVFYPQLRILENGRRIDVDPSGAIAGLMARIDSNRGVWKAPAGMEADLRGIVDLTQKLSDDQNGVLNPKGVNAIRIFPNGIINWGARTMNGDDDFTSEWKYIPVRRLALYLEESLYRGTKWIVFEPNDEPLWAQIRLNVGAFMHSLFRQGAFQGTTPREAYLVKCDKETTTQDDINRGKVNIVVGFAPLKPAEFVVIQIQQLAGQIQV